MLAPASRYGAPQDGPSAPKGFSAEYRQYSTNSLHSCSTANHGDVGTQREPVVTQATQQEDQMGNVPCSGELKRQGSGVDYDNMSEPSRHREAKRIVKDFVTEMVKGKEMIVVAPSGAFIDCFLGLTRGLETLKLKPKWPKDAQARRIHLS